MERQIGEVFEVKLKLKAIQTEGERCDGCYFEKLTDCQEILKEFKGLCCNREDEKYVIFKKED